MRHALPLLIAPLLTLGSIAQPAAVAGDPSAVRREAALDDLLAERESPEAFARAVEAARKQGVGEQAVLEATFLFHVDRREDARIAALLPEFLKRRDSFRLEDSAVFGYKEDWLAVVEYVQAIDCLGKGDREGFKKHITEAFWLSPRQAAAFAPHIERMRLDESMRSIQLDLGVALSPVAGGEPVSVAKLVDGRKALLLHFWSPFSRECEASMPDFAKSAAGFLTNGLAVVSLVPDDSPKLLEAAAGMIRGLDGKPCGAWLVDSKSKPFGIDLRVQSLPTMVLVSKEGRILFNGDPTDDAFWEALAAIDPAIKRPESARPLSEE